jgi:AraC-like DNA-binding protein
MREETVTATAVSTLLDFGANRGADRDELLCRAGLSRADLVDSDGRIPLARYRDLVRAAMLLTKDPAFALHYGEAVDVTEISLGPPLAAASSSIAEGFAAINRYSRLGVDVETERGGDRFELARGMGLVWLIDRRLHPNDFPELTESTFARMVSSTRRRFASVPLFKAVHFTHPAPSYAGECERVFRMRVTFASDRNALGLDESLLNGIRGPRLSPLVAEVLRERADSLLAKLDDTITTRRQVETVLSAGLPVGNTSVEFVARELALSRHTLFRRLKDEGVTFALVLDALRQRLATHYLRDVGLPVSRTASLLGYSDATAFARAFRRWTGAPPRTLSRSRKQSNGVL